MKQLFNPQIIRIGKELLKTLELEFGSNLTALVLYGSRVRGNNDPESDLDVLIILEKFDEKIMSRKISKFCGELTRNYFIKVSPFTISTDDYLFGCENLFSFNLGVYLAYHTLLGEGYIENCHKYIHDAIKKGILKVYPRSGIFIQRRE